MKRIYVSYRRTDTSESYGRLVSRLTDYFGAEAVLRTDVSYAMRHEDTESISPQDYRVFVAEQLRQCAVLLLVIGPHWLASPTPDAWDIHTPDDPARIEIEEALRAGIPVVPTLVQQAEMPKAGDLPPSVGLMLEQDLRQRARPGAGSLLALVSRTGMVVRRDPDFGGDAQRLCEVIENLARLEAANPEQAVGAAGRALRIGIALGGGALALHAVVLAYLATQIAMFITPVLAIAIPWQSRVLEASLIDWGVYFLLGYFISRRTGDVSLATIVSVASYLIGLVVGIVMFADLIWTNIARLTPNALEATPALLVGAPGWITTPVMYLTYPLTLTAVVTALGAPLGLAASVGLGALGAKFGANMRERSTERVVARQRRALLRKDATAGERRDPRATIFGPRRARERRYDQAALVGKVFISYRRDDSAVMCGAIYDRLIQAFGADAVFKDVDMIPVGVNFERFINTSLEECVAQVVVIGPRWVTISTADEKRRLDDPRDFVRLEVESALRAGLMVIPALTQGAELPAAADLPESLRPLAERTPINIRYAPDFDGDVRDLVQRLAPTMYPEQKRFSLLRRMISLRVGVAATTIAATWWLALFVALGFTAGLAAYRVFLLNYRVPPTFIIQYLASAPVIATGFALIGGAHLAFHTGQMRRALWLIMRAALASVEAFALTSQIYGLVVHGSDLIHTPVDLPFKLMAVGAPLAGLAMLLGPLLFSALLATAGGAFASQLFRTGGRRRRAPHRVAVLFRPEDAATAARITHSLSAWFGRRVVTQGRAQVVARAAEWLARWPMWTRIRQVIDETRWLRPVAFAFPRRAPPTEAEKIARSLRGAAAALVLVGPGWTAPGVVDAGLADPLDPIRLTVETALGMNIHLVPTLLAGATMPEVSALPASVREFAMLNGASVRNPPDYDGDTRRLMRVIERLTGLRQAPRLIDGVLPPALGALFSALALVLVDALAGLAVARGLSSAAGQLQPFQALTGVGVALVDLVIYGVTSALVTRISNRRALGALAALLGASLGASAGVFALHYASVWVQTIVTSQAGSGLLYDQFAALAVDYLAVRLLVAIAGAVIVGFLGALVGAVAYRGRARRVQERRLYAMVRSASRSESLPELSARSVGARATQPPVSARVTPPEIVAVALAADTATPSDSPVADGAVATESAGGVERERLLHDMASARRRARRRSQTRLFATASVVIVVALGALTSGGMLFFRQQAESSVQATALAASAATETEVAYARPAPYTDEMPGARCPGAHGAGVWKPDSAQSPQVTCAPDIGAAYLASVARNAKPYLLRLMLGHLIASAYKMSVSVSFTDLYTCVGLVFFVKIRRPRACCSSCVIAACGVCCRK